jgi:hypothetical protein
VTKLFIRAAALLASALFSSCLFPQTNAGQIVGMITDQQSASLEGVKITATNLATNVQQVTCIEQRAFTPCLPWSPAVTALSPKCSDSTSSTATHHR